MRNDDAGTMHSKPKAFLRPRRVYEFEVLATEAGGNPTISEGGVFCTRPIAPEDCVKPD